MAGQSTATNGQGTLPQAKHVSNIQTDVRANITQTSQTSDRVNTHQPGEGGGSEQQSARSRPRRCRDCGRESTSLKGHGVCS